MTDMRPTIVPKSDQLNADDLWGGPRTIKVTSVTIKPSTEQPVAISFDGDQGKPWKPCKSMSRVLVAAWGPDAKVYTGRSLTLYRDPDVTWAGMKVGGIRISHMSDIERDQTMALTVTKQSRKPFTVRVLQEPPPPAEPPAESASEPTEPVATRAAGASGKAEQARDRFMKRLETCNDLGSLAELQQKLGQYEKGLGEFYQECATALDAKKTAMMGDDGPDFGGLEDEEWKQQEGRVEDENQGELLG